MSFWICLSYIPSIFHHHKTFLGNDLSNMAFIRNMKQYEVYCLIWLTFYSNCTYRICYQVFFIFGRFHGFITIKVTVMKLHWVVDSWILCEQCAWAIVDRAWFTDTQMWCRSDHVTSWSKDNKLERIRTTDRMEYFLPCFFSVNIKLVAVNFNVVSWVLASLKLLDEELCNVTNIDENCPAAISLLTEIFAIVV